MRPKTLGQTYVGFDVADIRNLTGLSFISFKPNLERHRYRYNLVNAEKRRATEK